MAAIEIRNVQKSYGNLQVIDGLSLDIEDGQFVALVGPSGCGKSTLLRMISGLEDITDGEISIGDRLINNVAPKDRDIAMVFQDYALYPHMTVAKNMGFALKLAGESKEAIADRVHRSAKILDLTDYLDRYPKQLSGGQRQRVAMGRAIVRDPQVFLFDEPLSNLDAKLRVQMRAEIKELHQRLATTTVFVTHDQIEAMTLADKIVVMNGGRIEQLGTPLELYDQPESLFVAGFIGSPPMNLIHGSVGFERGRAVLASDHGPVLLLPDAQTLTQGQRIVFGFRPEHLHIVADEAEGAFDCILNVIEPTGAETQVNAWFGPKLITAVFRERHDLSLRQKIWLNIDLRRTVLFDEATGLRVR
ncbi:MAG: sugar ABC transporter ATP-binding protein [Robiginitomaculum sp.]|nr:MAG: sugar ABC transporter ATP-binding protein [Robiginitomaculum sp.]